MEKLKNVHPGEVLLEEFLIPFNISAYKLAKDIDIPQTRVSQIIKGNRRITADTALRLSKYFGNSAKFWLGLQDDFDLEEELRQRGRFTDTIQTMQQTLQILHDIVIKQGRNKSGVTPEKDISDWKGGSVIIDGAGTKRTSHSKAEPSKKVIARPHK